MNKLQLINPVRRQFEVTSQFFHRNVGLPSVHSSYIIHYTCICQFFMDSQYYNKEFESDSFVGSKAYKLLKLLKQHDE